MDQLLTIAELSQWLQVKPRTIYQWVHEGYIPVIKLGALIRFDRASVIEWIKKRETSGRVNRKPEFDID